jgi:hypothetical protein
MKYRVCVLDFATMTVQKESRLVATMAKAEKLEWAMLQKLDLDRYYTRIDGDATL